VSGTKFDGDQPHESGRGKHGSSSSMHKEGAGPRRLGKSRTWKVSW
jgi:hypothetical protein